MNVDPRVTLLDGSGGGDLDELVTFRIVPARMGRRCDKCAKGRNGSHAGIFEIDWGAMVAVLCKAHAHADWGEQYAAAKAAGGEIVRSAYDTFGGAAL